MTIDARHLNFNGGGHGGAIFALADSAFGLASNSHGPVAVRHRRAHHLPGGGRRRRRAGRTRDRGAAQPPHRRLPDRRRPRGRRRRRDRRLELHRHGVREGLKRTIAAPRRGRTGIHPRVLSRSLSSERQLGVKIFLQSAHRSGPGALPCRAPFEPVQTTFPRLLLEHAAARPGAPALREKEFGIWQTLSWGDLAALVRAMACGLAEAGPEARRASGRGRREPAAALRRDAGSAGARRGAGAALPGCRRDRVRVPDRQCRRRLRHRRGPGAGRQDDRSARLVPAASRASGTTTRGGCATTASRGWPRSTRSSRPAAPSTWRTPASSPPRSTRRKPRTSPRCSSPQGRPAIPRAWCTPTRP